MEVKTDTFSCTSHVSKSPLDISQKAKKWSYFKISTEVGTVPDSSDTEKHFYHRRKFYRAALLWPIPEADWGHNGPSPTWQTVPTGPVECPYDPYRHF